MYTVANTFKHRISQYLEKNKREKLKEKEIKIQQLLTC